MRKEFARDLEEINKDIEEVQSLLKESVSFCEDDDMEMEDPETEMTGMEDDMAEPEMEPEMGPEEDFGAEDTMDTPNVDSYVDQIRKFSINGLSALSDNPESEEYQMLKKIFQMCDKKPEKKGMNESRRVFGVLKESKNVILEAHISNKKDLDNLKKQIVREAKAKGINPSNIRLVSENKIIL